LVVVVVDLESLIGPAKGRKFLSLGLSLELHYPVVVVVAVVVVVVAAEAVRFEQFRRLLLQSLDQVHH
jgi:hypothetical protein